MKILPVIMSALISAFSTAPSSNRISEQELPQNVLFEIVTDHLSYNPEGKDKKVLFIGYDGFRRDCLPIITVDNDGAVSRIISSGNLLMTYAGGTRKAPQQTSTAAGWCSILTGKFAAESGVWNNKSVKRDSAETFLTIAAKLGYSCVFISSYHSHFDSTLVRDIRLTETMGTGCRYIQTGSDSESLDTARSVLADGECDVLFVIFEYPDSAGHAYGFSANEPEYAEACIKADRAAEELLNVSDAADDDNTDRLVLITTDHGGIGRRHGGQTDDERLTWAAVGK